MLDTLKFKRETLLSSADNLYKQFKPRSGPTECLSYSGSKLIDTDSVPERIFSNVNFEKSQQTTTKPWKITQHVVEWQPKSPKSMNNPENHLLPMKYLFKK